MVRIDVRHGRDDDAGRLDDVDGVDAIWGMYQWLDRAPLGRNEKGVWWRRHDEYGK